MRRILPVFLVLILLFTSATALADHGTAKFVYFNTFNRHTATTTLDYMYLDPSAETITLVLPVYSWYQPTDMLGGGFTEKIADVYLLYGEQRVGSYTVIGADKKTWFAFSASDYPDAVLICPNDPGKDNPDTVILWEKGDPLPYVPFDGTWAGTAEAPDGGTLVDITAVINSTGDGTLTIGQGQYAGSYPILFNPYKNTDYTAEIPSDNTSGISGCNGSITSSEESDFIIDVVISLSDGSTLTYTANCQPVQESK